MARLQSAEKFPVATLTKSRLCFTSNVSVSPFLTFPSKMLRTSLHSPHAITSERHIRPVASHTCPRRHLQSKPSADFLSLNGVVFVRLPRFFLDHTRAAALWSGNSRSKLRRFHGDGFCPAAQGTSEKGTNGAVSTRPSRNKSLGIVITGGSKGLGFALARKFLELNDRVIICGRDERRLSHAISVLEQENEGAFIDGIACDVSNDLDVERLAEFAGKRLGVIDRWLNNAGEVTGKKLLADLEAQEIVRVSGTNVVGSLLCCREAIRHMRQQPTSVLPIYHIFNMGFSQWGAKFTKSSCTHKATKIALTQLTESLSEELKTAGIFSIGVHNLSPGLVLTDLLLKDSTPIARRFFNTLAEEPETVAAILAPRIRAVRGSGQSINVLSPVAAVFKVLTGFPQIFSGGRFFDKDGNRVVVAGKNYHDNGVEVIY